MSITISSINLDIVLVSLPGDTHISRTWLNLFSFPNHNSMGGGCLILGIQSQKIKDNPANVHQSIRRHTDPIHGRCWFVVVL